MRTSLRLATRAYRRNGLVGLCRKIVETLEARAVESATHRYWRLRGERTVTVGDASAIFLTEYPAEIDVLDFLAAHERDVIADLLGELDADDVLFDVGANIGVYACLAADRIAADRTAAHLDSAGEVVAFEPYPPNVERLRANVARNDATVDVRPVGLAEATGTVRFDRAALDRPGWPLASITDAPDAIEVAVESGDALVERGAVPQPTVVKIDVEGAEPLVIEGMTECLSDSTCRLVYCEVHGDSDLRRSAADFGSGPDELAMALEACGFTVERIQERAHEVYLKGRR